MFGGKTTRLLAALDRYRYQKKNILLFKPKMDERYNKESITTHNGIESPRAILVETGHDLYSIFTSIEEEENVDVIAVDEAFMIPGCADALIKIYKTRAKTIVVSSIQLNSVGGVMAEIPKMMPWATEMTVCPAVCSECDANAHFTHKKSNQDNIGIEVGGSELYESLCYYHFDGKKGFGTDN
jgi:thymidine kinase